MLDCFSFCHCVVTQRRYALFAPFLGWVKISSSVYKSAHAFTRPLLLATSLFASLPFVSSPPSCRRLKGSIRRLHAAIQISPPAHPHFFSCRSPFLILFIDFPLHPSFLSLYFTVLYLLFPFIDILCKFQEKRRLGKDGI